jgi:hypothetical protein
LAQAERLDPKVERLVDRIASAQSAEDAAEGYALLFKSPDRNLNRRLKCVPQDGVALRAALEEARLGPMPPKDDGGTKLDRTAGAARFLGFVEGRLGLPLPEWWEEAIQKASFDVRSPIRVQPRGEAREEAIQKKLFDGRRWVMAGTPRESPYHQVAFGDFKKGMPKGQSVRAVGAGAALTIGDETAAVSAEVVKRHLTPAMCLSAVIDDGRCFVACHNEFSFSYDLLCLDRKGDLVWKATVWDSAYDGGVTGQWYEYVSVVVKGGRVYVFGTGISCFYIEAFEKADGKSVFRFANWYHPELLAEAK